MRRWTTTRVAAALAATLSVVACSGQNGPPTAAHPVTITIWNNYGTEQNATALANLATAFEKAHPAIRINVVSQDASNYFPQLQAAAIARNGPDLAVMWTGLRSTSPWPASTRQKFTSRLGKNVGAFVPPFSASPIQGVVDFVGDGLSQMSYSQHPAQDAEFLDFTTTPQAARIVDHAGLIPAITGIPTSNPVNQQMLDFVSRDHLTVYPMLDNVVQGDIVSTGQKFLPSVLGGQVTVNSALHALAATLDQLPASQRGSTFP